MFLRLFAWQNRRILNMDNIENFSKQLKALREEKQYSQKQLAEKLGVPVSTYANWEQGRREPSLNDIYNLIQVLETDANELFDVHSV